MSHTQYHSDTGKFTACMGYTGQEVGDGDGAGRPGLTSWRAASGCPDGETTALHALAAGIRSGVSPLQFKAGIVAGNEQMGNRAFLRWVEGLQAGGQDRNTLEITPPGMQGRESSLTDIAPLQLMSKRRKKKGVSVLEGTPEGVSKAMPKADAATAPEPEAKLEIPPGTHAQAGSEAELPLPWEESRETAVAVEKKKKKKSRVQVALNTLRAEGVEQFGRYIEAEIGEAELLRTLTERITRAQDLEARQEAVLRTVEERMRRLDPGHAVPVVTQATSRAQGQAAEMAIVAPAKTALNFRERELLECCLNGDVRKFKQLFKSRTVDANLAYEKGTLLYIAVVKGYTAIVRELLSKPGIDVNLAQKKGATPLGAAAELGHVELVKLLLAAPGINPNLGTFRVGTTPLSAAAYKGHLEVVKLLLTARKTNINVRQHDGATALFIATQKNFPGIVELLVRSGANVNLALDDGTTPLCVAAFMGTTEVVKRLIQVPDIQVDYTTHVQVTALAYATQQGHKDIVEFLLNKKADPNIADGDGLAPLHITCIHGYTDIARMLLNAEADLELKAGGIYAPYQIARWGGHQALADLLKAHRRNKVEQAAKFGKLSPCLRPAEPAPLLTTAGAGSAKAGGQALEDQPGRPSPAKAPAASLLQADTVTAVQPDAAVTPPPPVTLESGAAGGIEPVGMAQVAEGPVDISEAVPGTGSQSLEPQSPLARAKKEFIREILGKLREDWFDPLDGIRLLEAVNTVTDLDGLCSIYNRLASIERKKMRTRGRSMRPHLPAMGAQAMLAGAGPCAFALGDKLDLDAKAVEGEIKRHLAQSYYQFVSQAVNDMEFGRGKPTAGYPGLLHASAGIAGVGSCSVFFYTQPEGKLIRIVGIGHHLDRGTYRLDYAAAELRGLRTIRLS